MRLSDWLRGRGFTNDSAQPDFITGLQPIWVSSTQLGVGPGAAYIEGLRGVLGGTPANITPSSPSNNTWYHVYLYSFAGVATIEASTSAPVAYATPFGFARSKTSDTSRRYLYSARTNGSGNFYRFTCQQNGLWRWGGSAVGDIGDTPFRVLAGGAATTSTSIDASAVIPVSGRMAYLFGQQTTQNCVTYLTSGDITVSSTQFDVNYSTSAGSPNNGNITLLCPCSSTQTFNYLSSVAGAAYIDVEGFILQR